VPNAGRSNRRKDKRKATTARRKPAESNQYSANVEAASEFGSPRRALPDFTSTPITALHMVEHRDVDFVDEVVFLTGHSYRQCNFRGCTFVYKGPPIDLAYNNFGNNCSFHIDVVLFDAKVALDFIRIVTGWVQYMPGNHGTFIPDATLGSAGAASMSVSSVLSSESSLGGDDVHTSEGKTE